jgi:superfamily II DNA or RNA helicase
MELKKYQKKAIEILQNYLKNLVQLGAKNSFISVANKPYNSEFFNEIPFICIKIPTGGGKTLVGCQAIDEIMKTALNNKLDKGIVMWFVPSEAIKSQTLTKFKDRNDWHRKLLDEAFNNHLRIFSNEEALNIRKEDIENNLCIIISSLDAFRKEKTLQNKYKVYQENGNLMDHFVNIENFESLEKDENGTIINSLANVVRMSNPLFMIDEGHKTKTQLSIDFLKDLNPSFILEFTATPRAGSNILVDISSADLKEEQMVKIPIVLESANQWLNSIARGIEKRNELEKIAKKNKEYIRPIALIQAQPKSKTSNNITVEQIKEYLLKSKISEDEIAIKTSEVNEITGVNLFSKSCKIRYIITVNALAEGWDCSFAYVLISVANIGAKIAVEQIIGRIIRMPNAKKKDNENLNRCYIFASAKNFKEAATQIISGLETNGYSKYDLLNASETKAHYELEADRNYKEDLFIPMFCLDKDKLTFEDLIGEKFELSKQDCKFDFEIHYDNDGKAIIDITKDNIWHQGPQQFLKITYNDRNFSKEELCQWLDKKLRYTLLEKDDKVKFIEKIISSLLHKHSIAELSVNRYVLVDKLADKINAILEDYAKKQFDTLIKKQEISVCKDEKFPNTIILNQELPQTFNKNYYQKIDKLNNEELKFVERLDLDTLPNIKYWVRNREKKDPFYLQCWKKNKFYPDFIAITNKGNIIVLEWKGEDRVSNEDTEYKVEIGELWAKTGKHLNFFLVHNKNIEEVLKEIKTL